MLNTVFRNLLRGAFGCLLLALSVSGWGQVSHAAPTIITVNIAQGSGDCLSVGAACNLSSAVSTVNDGNGDTIHFNIPGTGPHQITLSNTLHVRKSVVIDATTQPGYAGTPLIELVPAMSGSGSPLAEDAIYVEDNFSYDPDLTVTIRGFAIGGFSNGVAILLGNGRGHLIEDNFIGTDATGMISRPNDGGISLRARESIIRDNLIASTDGSAISFDSNGERFSLDNVVQGNIIGWNRTQTVSFPNERGIVVAVTSARTQIGGVNPGEGNMVANSRLAGIHIAGPYDITPVGENVVEGNIVTGNGHGIIVERSTANIIGGTTGVTPGGSCTGACNLVSGNRGSGISADGLNTIQGNFVGTDVTGMLAYPNGTVDDNDPESGGRGVSIGNSVLLGGLAPEARNIISGNLGIGLIVGGTGSTIQGNYIGVATDGITPLGNFRDGVRFTSESRDHLVGGEQPEARNIIANNGGHGVTVYGVTPALLAYNNALLGNSIYGNGRLGIDLNTGEDRGGVNPNDPGDFDEFGNMGQNYPVLTIDETFTEVTGALNSAVNTTYRIELFYNEICNPVGHGEGQTLLTAFSVTTDSAGNATFNYTLAQAISGGQSVTATATDPAGNTSEFSNCVREIGPGYTPEDDSIYTGEPNYFSWARGYALVTSYRLQVRDAAGTMVINRQFTPDDICNLVLCSLDLDIDLLPNLSIKLRQNKAYTWRVGTTVAGNTTYTGWFSFTNRVLPVPVVTLAPTQNAKLSDPRTMFTWTPAPNGTAYRVVLRNATTKTIMADVKLQSDIACNPFDQVCFAPIGDYTKARELLNGKYTWQVTVTGQQIQGMAKSALMTFSIQFPGKAVLSQPANKGVVNSKSPTFVWSAVPLAYEYRLIVVDTLTKRKLLNTWEVSNSGGLACADTTCTFTPESPLPLRQGRTYQWYVQTRDLSVSKNISTSAKRMFKVNFNAAIQADGLRGN
jgi:parallel beta-helix repeat protein